MGLRDIALLVDIGSVPPERDMSFAESADCELRSSNDSVCTVLAEEVFCRRGIRDGSTLFEVVRNGLDETACSVPLTGYDALGLGV